MQHTTPLYRRTPAITGLAALGLVTTVMLAPAAHADTDLDLPEGSASTVVVADAAGAAETGGTDTTAETAPEPVTGTGEEATAESGEALTSGTDEASAPETGDEPPVDAEAGPADATEGTPAAGPAEQDGLCADGAAGDQQDAGTGDTAPTDTGLGDATIDTGTDGTDGTAETAAAAAGAGDGDGTLTGAECAATAPDQAGTGPGAPAGDDTQLPVGGVDAGRGEAAGQNMVLPIATAGALAAAVSLGAYTLVRRRRSAA